MLDGVLDRIRKHLEAGTTDSAGGLRRVPASRYADPERFRIEADRIFRRRPIAVALASQLARPGDYVVRDILGTCFFVVAGEDGIRRAFVNACRHRGTRLVDGEQGRELSRIACGYHCWTYDTRGALVSRPDEGRGFAGVDTATLGLVELPLIERFGLVFVTLDPDSPAFDALAAISPELDFFGVGEWQPVATRSDTVAANWKAVVENFLEGYHVRNVHAGTVARKVCESLTLYDGFGEHARIIFPSTSLYGAGLASDAPPGEIARHLSVNYFVFPSTVMLVVSGDHVLHETFTPLAPDRTRVDRSVFVKGDAGSGKWAKVASFFDAFVAEDYRVIEGVQQGARSLGDRDLLVGTIEQGVSDFHRAVERAIEE